MADNTIDKFRCLHDEAFLYINQAITQEKPDINRKDVALMMYQRGLGLIDQALCVDTEGKGPEYERMRKQQEKMNRTREHVEARILELTNVLAPPINRSAANTQLNGAVGACNRGQTDQPKLPSYSEATSQSPQHAPPSYEQSREQHILNVNRELDEIAQEAEEDPPGAVGGIPNSGSSGSLAEQGNVVFTLPQVQIFYITPSGEVTTPSYPETLHIIKFVRNTQNVGLAPAFIEVGNWTYPLVIGQSAILKSNFGGYMFPDLESGIQGSSVGLMLPDTITTAEREQLDKLLEQLTTAVKTEEEIEEEYKEYKEFSGALSEGLVKGAELVGKGMVKGAVKTSEMLFHGADLAKNYITPENPKPVDARVLKGLEVAKVVSTGACRVSGWMVSKVGSATMALGRMVAPHIERSATKALTNFSGQSKTESENQLKIVGEIASGTLAAVSTLYMALENSSKILAKNLANNTVILVSHKYGTDAAAVTDAAFSTAGNSYLAFYNAAALGPKGIAKRAAKDAGKAMIGFDPDTVNARASRAPDSNIGVKDVVQTFAKQKEKDGDDTRKE